MSLPRLGPGKMPVAPYERFPLVAYMSSRSASHPARSDFRARKERPHHATRKPASAALAPLLRSRPGVQSNVMSQ